MLPAVKLFTASFKIISRPLNNYLKKFFAHRFIFMNNYIIFFGQNAHKFEIFLNRKIVNGAGQPQIDFYIKPLSDEAAFNKGIDYFVEIVFFYGLLIGIAVWELKKS